MAKNKGSNYLDYIPVHNSINEWDENNGIVTVHMVNHGFFSAITQKFFHTPKISHIDLDNYGSVVWKAIDGKKTVFEIGEILKEKFGDNANPLYRRLVKYIQILWNNKFILLVGKDKIKSD